MSGYFIITAVKRLKYSLFSDTQQILKCVASLLPKFIYCGRKQALLTTVSWSWHRKEGRKELLRYIGISRGVTIFNLVCQQILIAKKYRVDAVEAVMWLGLRARRGETYSQCILTVVTYRGWLAKSMRNCHDCASRV